MNTGCVSKRFAGSVFLAVACCVAMGSPALAQGSNRLPTGWKSFRPDDQSFKVAFPQVPVKEVGTEEDHLKKPHKAVTYRVGKMQDQISYSVIVIDGIDFPTADQRQKEFINFAQIFAPIVVAGAEFFDVKEVKFAGADYGFEYSGMVNTQKKGLGDGILHIHRRAYLANGKAILVTFTNRKSVDSAEKTAFFDSFQLVGSK